MTSSPEPRRTSSRAEESKDQQDQRDAGKDRGRAICVRGAVVPFGAETNSQELQMGDGCTEFGQLVNSLGWKSMILVPFAGIWRQLFVWRNNKVEKSKKCIAIYMGREDTLVAYRRTCDTFRKSSGVRMAAANEMCSF